MTSSRCESLPRDANKAERASTSKSSLIKFADGRIPGVCGIHNHGNSCFASGIVQCLSNSDLFAELFITGYCQLQSVAAERVGRSCDVTEKLAQLIDSLWTCRYTAEISREFLDAVSEHSTVFAATKQSDAQEFLLWLLNRLSDELYGEDDSESNKSACSHSKIAVRFFFYSIDYLKILSSAREYETHSCLKIRQSLSTANECIIISWKVCLTHAHCVVNSLVVVIQKIGRSLGDAVGPSGVQGQSPWWG
jgi:ubiquitin C-terminal hydrolase